jgi:plasmid stabilization system protein ParE
MAQVTYSTRALGALEYAVKPPPADAGSAASAAALAAIESAVNTLAAHPLVGRRVDGDLRELVISFGETGFIALYRFVVQSDAVRVLALRRQSEIGYMP